jgi:hypothetical protein
MAFMFNTSCAARPTATACSAMPTKNLKPTGCVKASGMYASFAYNPNSFEAPCAEYAQARCR